jgi:tRNA(fMet)-specific endonuclease VapC
MPGYLLDTNQLRFLEQCQPTFMGHFLLHRANVATSIICAQEVLKGRLSAIATARRAVDLIDCYYWPNESLNALGQLTIVLFEANAESRFQQIRKLRLKTGSQDQRIAATALANGMTLVTSNIRDFKGVPGLQLADWSV